MYWRCAFCPPVPALTEGPVPFTMLLIPVETPLSPERSIMHACKIVTPGLFGTSIALSKNIDSDLFLPGPVWIKTAYIPNPAEWTEDFSKRRKL